MLRYYCWPLGRCCWYSTLFSWGSSRNRESRWIESIIWCLRVNSEVRVSVQIHSLSIISHVFFFILVRFYCSGSRGVNWRIIPLSLVGSVIIVVDVGVGLSAFFRTSDAIRKVKNERLLFISKLWWNSSIKIGGVANVDAMLVVSSSNR